ncbi:hypothetical protein Tsp_08043 [Trichinella spiralis]|uniref:hypothetical protein n=1 Tax=Trichinella spiralis TaxID=6334 RepID=UPI0001EFDF15|nr:hypothetical protein Tsp_08043 [Trichinella spiralis]
MYFNCEVNIQSERILSPQSYIFGVFNCLLLFFTTERQTTIQNLLLKTFDLSKSTFPQVLLAFKADRLAFCESSLKHFKINELRKFIIAVILNSSQDRNSKLFCFIEVIELRPYCIASLYRSGHVAGCVSSRNRQRPRAFTSVLAYPTSHLFRLAKQRAPTTTADLHFALLFCYLSCRAES